MAELIEQTTETPETPAPVVVKKSHAGLWVAILSLILVVLLAGAGFYFFQQIQLAQRSENSNDAEELIVIKKSLVTLQDQIASLQGQVANVNSELTGKDNHFNQTLADFSKLHDEHLDTTRKELEAQISALQRQLSKTRGDWLLADAEYTLTIANQRLTLLGDVNTARQALEAADQRLRESGHTSIYKIREQIAKEIGLLNGVNAADLVGLYAEIQRLQDGVEALSVFLPHAGKQPEQASSSETATPDQPSGLLGSIAHALKGYVIVRNTSQPVNGILTPEEASFIKQQLKVRLEMIKIALVQQNDTLFITSVADAKQWLKTNFAENQITDQYSIDLEKLAQVQIRSHYPDISSSLKQLQEFNQVHKVEPEKPEPQQPPAAIEPAKNAAPATLVAPAEPTPSAPATTEAPAADSSQPAAASEAHPQ